MSVDDSVRLPPACPGRTGLRDAARLGLLIVGTVVLFATVASAADEVVFGPQTYTATGRPQLSKRTFSVRPGGAGYTLRVQNRGVLAAFILLNGRVVLRPRDFSDSPERPDGNDAPWEREWDRRQRDWRPEDRYKTVPLIEKPVMLRTGVNEVFVAFVGRPGTSFSIDVSKPTGESDTTPPVISSSVNPLPNVNGWNNTPVTVSFACSDSGSGIKSCPAPTNVTTQGANQLITGTAVDNAGNATNTTTAINLDSTPPVLTATLSPPPNADGWNRVPVTVIFGATDSLSGIRPDAVTPPVTLDVEGTGLSASGQATDLAGNVRSISRAGINIDRTPPTIQVQFDPEFPNDGVFHVPVTVHFTCTDTRSGVRICPADQVFGSDGPNQIATGAALDRADNAASFVSQPFTIQLTAVDAQHTITVIRSQPPTIPSNAQTVVTITSQIPSATHVVASSVHLRQSDMSGQVLASLPMFDDGTHGDQRANDGVFTVVTTLSYQGPQILSFQVSVSFDDWPGTVLSTPLILPVESDETVSSALADLASALRVGDKNAAYQRLGESFLAGNLLNVFASSALVEVAAALQTCTLSKVSASAQTCRVSAPLDGHVTDFEFLAVRDAFGVWRIIQW